MAPFDFGLHKYFPPQRLRDKLHTIADAGLQAESQAIAGCVDVLDDLSNLLLQIRPYAALGQKFLG